MNTTNEKIEEFSKKSKIIKLFNPFANRKTYGCPLRLCLNTYAGCFLECSYCYNHWQINFTHPRTKKQFEKNIEKDINLIIKMGLDNLIISVSNSTEPLQSIESIHKHTLLALNLFYQKSLKVLIVTKNPAKLLENEYLKVLKPENTAIEVSIAFYEQRIDLEPFAPAPKERINAVKELIRAGFNNMAVRVDPLIPSIPNSNIGQSPKEINELINCLSSIGVNHVVSKVLRLVGAIAKVNPSFYRELKVFYKNNGSWEKNCYTLNPETREELLRPVYEACLNNGIKLSTCYEVVSFKEAFKCDLAESKLGVCPNT